MNRIARWPLAIAFIGMSVRAVLAHVDRSSGDSTFVACHEFRFSGVLETPVHETAAQPEVSQTLDRGRDPELARVLTQWRQATAGIARLDCRFTWYRYDHVFDVEKRGVGELSIDSDGRTMHRLKPAKLSEVTVSRMKDHNGTPYRLQAEKPGRTYWTGSEFIQINESDHSIQRFPFADDPLRHSDRPVPPALPEERVPVTLETVLVRITTGQRIESSSADWFPLREFWIPRALLLGPRDDTLEREFHVRMMRQTPEKVWISFTPRGSKWSRRFESCELILHRSNWMPVAVKCVSPIRNEETVHVFSDLHINRADHDAPDLKNPDLSGYRPSR